MSEPAVWEDNKIFTTLKYSDMRSAFVSAEKFELIIFFSQFQRPAAHMEAEEFFSKREGPSLPSRTENPWIYSQRGQCHGTL